MIHEASEFAPQTAQMPPPARQIEGRSPAKTAVARILGYQFLQLIDSYQAAAIGMYRSIFPHLFDQPVEWPIQCILQQSCACERASHSRRALIEQHNIPPFAREPVSQQCARHTAANDGYFAIQVSGNRPESKRGLVVNQPDWFPRVQIHGVDIAVYR
jgi:hypothetical protein